jgi:carboxypeptidase PM20D1
MKKVLSVIFIVVALLIAVLLVNTFTFESRQISVAPVTGVKFNVQQAADRLSKAIPFKTISHQDPGDFDLNQFNALIHYLETSFPRVHADLKKEVVADASLLYTWEGSNPDLKPIILLAHTDVVPIAPGTTGDWTHPPFSGKIADGFVWGRGTMDYKVGVLGMLEAVEDLALEGFKPKRTIYLAFGHDEEVGGKSGAGNIAELLKKRNVRAEWLLDEGGVIISGAMPGISKPVALLGMAEKGYVTLKLTAKAVGGHSSMPPAETAIGILSTAIHNLEKNPFPPEFGGVVREMFNYVAPEMPFGMKLLFANQWLLSPIIKSQLQKSASINAMLRTTIAPTVINAGTKENVLPQKAEALINFRIYPGNTVEHIVDHVKKSINDPRIKIETSEHDVTPASPVTATDTESYKMLHKTVRQIFPNVLVAPYLLVGGTDTKHYVEVADHIFRFLPMRLKGEDLKRLHGTNERMKITNYEEIVKFYAQMIKNAN